MLLTCRLLDILELIWWVLFKYGFHKRENFQHFAIHLRDVNRKPLGPFRHTFECVSECITERLERFSDWVFLYNMELFLAM